ncbi:MAG: hypothetical protein CPSOU_2061 [uncultured Paraburkholderia sp.]|nr:MAG: hypothetical protein CPSOU_2061 [uncultured Paraburkholderia sp.]
MLDISREVISYVDHLGKDASHYILIAEEAGQRVLLSHPNVYLSKTTGASIKTSMRYSGLVAMFYRFLSGQEKYRKISVSQYHSIVDNDDIKRWQVARQQARLATVSAGPTSHTIFEDAKVVLNMFHWLNRNSYVTNVNVSLKTWVANFKSDDMLHYLQSHETEKIDSSSIRVLDKER